MEDQNTEFLKERVRVIGSLRSGFITVIFGVGQGMSDGGISLEIPIDIVPVDLRVPNSEFVVVIDRFQTKRFVATERIS
jgi:hypothetical protein